MFGTVFLGFHVKSAKRVAIKVSQKQQQQQQQQQPAEKCANQRLTRHGLQVFDWETLTKAGKRPERKAEKQLRREIGAHLLTLFPVFLAHDQLTSFG